MSFPAQSVFFRHPVFGAAISAVFAVASSAGAAPVSAGGVPTAYQTAMDEFFAAARAEGLELAPGTPQCLDFSSLTTASKASGDSLVASCRVELPCARLTLAGLPNIPQTFALSGHVDPVTCQDPRWRDYERAFATAFLRCESEGGRIAALDILADRPVKLDDPSQPAISDPRIESRPEAVAFQAACGAMTAIRRLQTTSDGRNEDIVLKPAVKP